MLFKATQIVEAIQALGYGKDLNTGLNRWLAGMTGQTGATNTLWFNYLRGLGYDGSLNTMMAAYYEASHGAAITSPIPSLFRNSEKGIWLDPSDLTSMFQDSVGTTAAVVGQSVGLVLDKSQGLVLGSELVVNGGFDSATGWSAPIAGAAIAGGVLAFDGTTSIAIGATITSETLAASVVGRTYKITYTINGGTTLPVSVTFAGTGTTARTTAGTYTEYVTAANTTGVLLVVARTTAGARTGSIDNVSVKELPGYHATQSTSTARPILARHPITGRRNLLTYTEDFSNAAWSKSRLEVFSNTTTAPDGSLTADTISTLSGTSAGEQYCRLTRSDTGVYSHSWYVKKNNHRYVSIRNINYSTFDFDTGTFTLTGVGETVSASSIGNGWYRLSAVATCAGSHNPGIAIPQDATNVAWGVPVTGTAVYIWGSQFEADSTTAYQKVTSAYDVTEAGVNDAYFLQFDGVDDFLVTPSIDFSGTDKMSVFAGVRKLSDAAAGVVVELSTSAIANAGTFLVTAPENAASAKFGWASKGTTLVAPLVTATAPITAVLTCIGNISAPLASISLNGGTPTSITTTQGTGSYGNYPIYIGMRAGSTGPANMHLYSLVVRGALSDAAQITSAEAYVNGKTGAY